MYIFYLLSAKLVDFKMLVREKYAFPIPQKNCLWNSGYGLPYFSKAQIVICEIRPDPVSLV